VTSVPQQRRHGCGEMHMAAKQHMMQGHYQLQQLNTHPAQVFQPLYRNEYDGSYIFQHGSSSLRPSATAAIPSKSTVPETGGLIFRTNNATQADAMKRNLLGDTLANKQRVLECRKGAFIFMYNTDEKKLHGIYRAVCNGEINIDPYAWPADAHDMSRGSKYPAQIRFKIEQQCNPLGLDDLRQILDWSETGARGRRHFKAVLNAEEAELLKRKLIACSPESDPLFFDGVGPIPSSGNGLDLHGDFQNSKGWPKGQPPYLPSQYILTVGDDNLSYSCALCKIFLERHDHDAPNLYASVFDTEQQQLSKYGAAMSVRLEQLQQHGAHVLHEVDACNLGACFEGQLCSRACVFDRIVWHFPHALFDYEHGSEDTYRELLRAFFASAASLLSGDEAQVHISLTGVQYRDFAVDDASKAAGLERVGSVKFEPSNYPGYCISHERGMAGPDGFGNGASNLSRTHFFRRARGSSAQHRRPAAKRLRELSEQLQAEFVTPDEFEVKRRSILDDLVYG